MQSLKDQAAKKGPNFTITKKDLSVGVEAPCVIQYSLIFLIDRRVISSKFDLVQTQGEPISLSQIERSKTKEQIEEEKRIALSIRIKPLTIDNLGAEKLKAKVTELWEAIVKLETEKYDLEERQKRQEYDVSSYD